MFTKLKNFGKITQKLSDNSIDIPHRNKVLGRDSTEEEIAFLNSPNSSW